MGALNKKNLIAQGEHHNNVKLHCLLRKVTPSKSVDTVPTYYLATIHSTQML